MATRSRMKAEERNRNKDIRPYAIARYIRISSGKVGVVLDLVRGKDFKTACAILEHTPKAASYAVLKCLKSAGANAEMKGYDKDSTFVAECYANEGPQFKRVMPRAQGRAYRILKRTSHITIVLDQVK